MRCLQKTVFAVLLTLILPLIFLTASENRSDLGDPPEGWVEVSGITYAVFNINKKNSGISSEYFPLKDVKISVIGTGGIFLGVEPEFSGADGEFRLQVPAGMPFSLFFVSLTDKKIPEMQFFAGKKKAVNRVEISLLDLQEAVKELGLWYVMEKLNMQLRLLSLEAEAGTAETREELAELIQRIEQLLRELS